jgi:hypothetical protein
MPGHVLFCACLHSLRLCDDEQGQKNRGKVSWDGRGHQTLERSSTVLLSLPYTSRFLIPVKRISLPSPFLFSIASSTQQGVHHKHPDEP